MKPLTLTMSAFGSYADTQTIDFTELGASGLYLITGETGSGKTTIFDAVSYALFGKASGKAREKYAMLRSDYVEGRVKTFVALDFTVGNDAYNIVRTIHPHIARNTAAVTYTDSVLFTLADQTILDRDDEVRAKIAEIVGLDRDQFAQIVMIAQNDFLRFLQSGTEERVKILRHIFGTGALKYFQENLKSRAKELDGELDVCRRDFARHELDPYRRGEQFAAWEMQIKTGKAELAAAEEKLAAYDQQSRDLAARTAVAEELAAKFTGLAVASTLFAEHSEKAGEMKRLAMRRARGEIALRQVKPLAAKAADAEKQYAAAQTDLAKAKEDAETALAELTEAKRDLAELPPLGEKRTTFEALKRAWEQSTVRLTKLNVLKSDYGDIVKRQEKCHTLQEQLAAVLKTMAALPPLAAAQAAFEQVKQDGDKAETRLTRLAALNDDFAAITAKQAGLKALQSEFEALNTAFSATDGACKAMEEAFLRGQAGILAAALTDGKPCPVCGSSEHPVPARLADEDISESKLKKAKERLDKARRERDAKTAECFALSAQLDTLSRRLLADLSELEMISPAVSEAARILLLDKQTAVKSERDALAAKKTADEESLSALTWQWDSAIKKRDELQPQCTEGKAAVETLIQRFTLDLSEFASDAAWDTAGEKLAASLAATTAKTGELTLEKETEERRLAEWTQKHEAALQRHTDADKAQQAGRTLAAERERREREQFIRRDEAQSACAAALDAHGFADETAYRAALMAEEELSAAAKQITAYEKEAERLHAEMTRLTAETAGKEKPDPATLTAEAETVNTAATELRGKRDAIKSRLEQTERVLKELQQSAVRFAQLEKQYAAVKQLSDAANGKLDFETYAQTAYFERVLQAANVRLKLMSQNRYTLLRKTDSDDGRKRSGLELEVLDAYTGKARSANSLSGGESFMASLSLALGLSDVVQQSAGGIRLEAMFIDEGFGSLDPDVLELAVRTLSDMTGSGRMIGIISHVAELRERIDKQVRVEKTPAGSKIRLLV
jgi:exonuclease SbcC